MIGQTPDAVDVLVEINDSDYFNQLIACINLGISCHPVVRIHGLIIKRHGVSIKELPSNRQRLKEVKEFYSSKRPTVWVSFIIEGKEDCAREVYNFAREHRWAVTMYKVKGGGGTNAAPAMA